MRLPGAESAVVDIRKLVDNCLSADHFRGRHKARVFAAVLGITAAEAGELRQLLLMAAAFNECSIGQTDQYGIRYVIDFDVARGAWIGRI